jgi:hypothetical protein
MSRKKLRFPTPAWPGSEFLTLPGRPQCEAAPMLWSGMRKTGHRFSPDARFDPV